MKEVNFSDMFSNASKSVRGMCIKRYGTNWLLVSYSINCFRYEDSIICRRTLKQQMKEIS